MTNDEKDKRIKELENTLLLIAASDSWVVRHLYAIAIGLKPLPIVCSTTGQKYEASIILSVGAFE